MVADPYASDRSSTSNLNFELAFTFYDIKDIEVEEEDQL
jgi:hypothetical protein